MQEYEIKEAAAVEAQEDVVPMPPIKVYVRLNDKGEVVAVGSDVFVEDLNGWIYIDEGYGDKYAHAQSQYFERPLKNRDGTANYRFEGNAVVSIG